MNFVSKDMRAPEFIDIQSFSGTRFLITVDTEEEFNWDKPFTRDQHGTSHIGAIARFQTLCERSGVKPVYLVDYPIADDPKAVDGVGQVAERPTLIE